MTDDPDETGTSGKHNWRSEEAKAQSEERLQEFLREMADRYHQTLELYPDIKNALEPPAPAPPAQEKTQAPEQARESPEPVRESGPDVGYTAQPKLVPGMPGYRKDLEPVREQNPIVEVPVTPDKGPEPPAKTAPEPASQHARQKFLEEQMKAQRLTKDKGQEKQAPPRALDRWEHDSPERRAADQERMAKIGVDEHLREVKDLLNKSQAAPPEAAVQKDPRMTSRTAGRTPDTRGPERDRGPEQTR